MRILAIVFFTIGTASLLFQIYALHVFNPVFNPNKVHVLPQGTAAFQVRELRPQLLPPRWLPLATAAFMVFSSLFMHRKRFYLSVMFSLLAILSSIPFINFIIFIFIPYNVLMLL